VNGTVNKPRILIAAATLVVLVTTPAAAGAIFDLVVKDAAGDATDRHSMIIDGSLLRMDTQLSGGEPRVSVIFRADREEMLVLDHPRREAMVIDKATIEQIASQMSQARAQMEQALASVPEGQREMMEKMMASRMKGMMSEPEPPAEVRKTSDTGTTNGYAWTRYEVLQEGSKIREFLVADRSSLDVEASTFDAFKEMAAFFESLTESLGAGMGPAVQNPFDEASRLDGFPVVVRDFEDGALVGATELVEVKTAPVPPSLFENPGYKLKKLDIPNP
jgi:hypothetical protein